jgi:hypothetical protein
MDKECLCDLVDPDDEIEVAESAGLCPVHSLDNLSEQQQAELAYPKHAPSTALANWRAGREIWDSNGDML